jgi:glutamate racemase
MISLVVGEEVTLVSSAEETAKDVYRVLVREGLERPSDLPPPQHQFLATGDAGPFERVGRRFLGPQIGQVSTIGDPAMELAGAIEGQEKLCS